MLVIRLKRAGKKNKPTYRLTVAEHAWAVNGKIIADLGSYNPHTKQTSLKIDEIKVWLDKGARPSNSAARLLQNEKVKHALVVVVKKNKKAKATKEEKPAAPAAETAVEPTVEVATETPATDQATEPEEAPTT